MMNSMKKGLLALTLASTLVFSGCGYNTLQAKDEAVNAAWSEVQNQYQRRADLVPNLVQVVQGYAKHEEKVFIEVAAARASVSSLKVDKEVLENPELFKKYEQAQSQLQVALKSLLSVQESYPDLKANEQFRALQDQLEGTENRISTARGRYVETVQNYNTYVRQFPQAMTAKVIGMKTKENFSADTAAQKVPTVNFNN